MFLVETLLPCTRSRFDSVKEVGYSSTKIRYDLDLESGPKQKKPMVHVSSLLGCAAVSATIADALDATPQAIEQSRRFLARHCDESQIGATFATQIIHHLTEGSWLGNGSTYISFQTD